MKNNPELPDTKWFLPVHSNGQTKYIYYRTEGWIPIYGHVPDDIPTLTAPDEPDPISPDIHTKIQELARASSRTKDKLIAEALMSTLEEYGYDPSYITYDHEPDMSIPDMPDGTDEPTPTTDIQDTPPWMTRDYLPLTVSPLITEGTQPLPDEPPLDMPDFTPGNPIDHIAWRVLPSGLDTTNMPDGTQSQPFRATLSGDPITTKQHPSYPLIGLEFEPQLTLLNYPNKKVVIAYNCNNEIKVFTTLCNVYVYSFIEDLENSIVLLLPDNYNNYIDSGSSNLEFRTNPVSFTELPAELNRINATFQSVMLEIAKVTGPLAAFLPANPCTKHVNLSVPSCEFPPDLYHTKPGVYGQRIHIKVPYNFTNYSSLLPRLGTPTTQLNTPICLGYTYTGDSWMELNWLS